MKTRLKHRPAKTALAVAATAAAVVAVGTVVLVTPFGGSETRTAADRVGGATPTGGPAGTDGSGYAPSGAGSSSGSAGSSNAAGTPSTAAGSPTAAGPASGSTPSKQGSQSPSTIPTHPATTPVSPSATSRTPPPTGAGLDDPGKKEIAMELVSSAENSSLDWRAQYKYIQDIHDGRGYTGGIIGFCSGTGDMLEVVQRYAGLEPGNILTKYISALKADNGSATHSGLDPNFPEDWVTAAADPKFQQAQNDERDAEYFTPAVDQAKADGLGTLGQFIYYDAMVMHGPGSDPQSFGGIRAAARRAAKPPSQGGDQIAYLNAYLDARIVAMKADPSHQDTSRVDTEQRLFVRAGNLDLAIPLHWWTYGDAYRIG